MSTEWGSFDGPSVCVKQLSADSPFCVLCVFFVFVFPPRVPIRSQPWLLVPPRPDDPHMNDVAATHAGAAPLIVLLLHRTARLQQPWRILRPLLLRSCSPPRPTPSSCKSITDPKRCLPATVSLHMISWRDWSMTRRTDLPQHPHPPLQAISPSCAAGWPRSSRSSPRCSCQSATPLP